MDNMTQTQCLPAEEIERRFKILWTYFKDTQGESLPLPLAVMASNFIPQIPKLLADPGRQKEILDFLILFAWSIGYSAVFEFAGEDNCDIPMPPPKEPV